ncbi:MAG: type II toxin-antitoxin system RatA family toxin [Proteobacteria bacterium]|nr:type II toxin-antitoxin system RatA family toxin [Pseudomonadota bacterium]
MPAVQRNEFIPFSPKQMFDLVNNVEAYPEFLPWCSKARKERVTEDGIVATLTVAKGPMQHSFTTKNTNREFERIEMGLIAGPFKSLHGVWRFDEQPGGCKVSLELDFEFSNRILAAALSKIFQMLTGSMVEAFRQRAASLYG